ncbi:MAG: peptidoglycan recognition family protein [Phycisphaerales bacterium]
MADARDTLIVRAPDARALSRRDAIRAGGGLAALALLAGCAGAKRTASLPSPLWPSDVPMSPSQNMRSWPAEPTPTPAAREPEAAPLGPLRVNPRSSWATAGIVPARMDRQSPLRRITIHHDGMPPVSIAGRADAAARIDLIRRLHQDNQGWGDIGYHYIVDPTGGVWEGRTLNWQGAHVANQNPGNIGVMCLGNFEVQSPTQRQVAALDALVVALGRQYRVPIHEVKTHQELAPTACPGRSLQAYMNRTRMRGGAMAARLA